MPSNLFNTFTPQGPDFRALRKALVAFRIDRAKRLGMEPYRVFPNATLELLVAARPDSIEELAAIKGMGPKKMKQFGEDLLVCMSEASADATSVSYDEKPTADNGGNTKAKAKPAEQKPLTVSDYLEHVNDALYREQAVVQAEISDCQIHPTGIYLTLKDKDAEAVLKCYINPRLYASLGVPLENGMEVRVGGFPQVRPANGRFSLQVQSLELAGEGSLKKAYELLKKKLQEEGLFDRKRPLPERIQRIGIITSRTGAVIGDFRTNLEQLGYELSLYDVRVEGAQAVPNILKALDWFNQHADEFDVLTIIRGGGSLEDMQAFNNERVARAVFASRVPTICGIGHDRDVSIVALVGDFECSTPSIAAGTVNASWQKFRRTVVAQEQSLVHAGDRVLRSAHHRLDGATRSLMGAFGRLVGRPAVLARELTVRFVRAYQACATRVLEYERNLVRMNPERTLQLGYSIIRDAKGAVVRDAQKLAAGDSITARLAKGSVDARVTGAHEANA